MQRPKSIDRTLLGIVLILVGVGLFIFSSASLGLLAREGASFSSVALTQIVFGIIGGLAVMALLSRVHYRIWRKYAFYIFLLGIGVSLLVFTPLGSEYGGARRWIEIFGFSAQPSEFLKIAFVIYVATWFSGWKPGMDDFIHSTLPFLLSILVVAIVMLLQKDTDAFIIMATAGAAIYFVQCGKWKELVAGGVALILLVGALAMYHDYLRIRLLSFANPGWDEQGAGYQIKQSLIAVGSGGAYGRGFGQSVQKFDYLPEPIGDSIFAVFAEEFGFVGTVFLILLFSGFVFRGYRLATHAPDDFGMLVTVGFVTMIIFQAFLHMAATMQFAPILGLPLPFISHGGTAMMATLAMVGIILNISRYRKKGVG